MQQIHKQSPLHHIECWTSSYFQQVALWEVGTYILVKHHKIKHHMVKHHSANPYPNDEQVVQSKLQALVSLLGKAKQLQDVARIVPVASSIEPFVENEGEFDNVGESVLACDISKSHQNTQG